MQVSIQHFKEYNYSEMVTPAVIHGAIDKAAADNAVADVEECCLQAK